MQEVKVCAEEVISPKQLYFPFYFVVAFVSTQKRIEYLSILFVNKTACEHSATCFKNKYNFSMVINKKIPHNFWG